jgi:hypothetical protein
MATLSAKAKPAEEELPPRNAKVELLRYRLQVDRLTKSSYASKEEAQKVGSAIKTKFPKLHVTIYDAEESETTKL